MKSPNVVWHAPELSADDRIKALGQQGHAVWFTGLSGSGKSTLARRTEAELIRSGVFAITLDGDNVRHGLSGDLGFSEADRKENLRRVTHVARMLVDAGAIVLVSFISPFRKVRIEAADTIGRERFDEVYVSTPLSVCEERDTKGLYEKARRGEIKNMTGISSPFEAPKAPALSIDGSNWEHIDAGSKEIVNLLKTRGVLECKGDAR